MESFSLHLTSINMVGSLDISSVILWPPEASEKWEMAKKSLL